MTSEKDQSKIEEKSLSDIYDITYEMRDEYTNLQGRDLGAELEKNVGQRLTQICEGCVLYLDFGIVTDMSESYLDDFLKPLLVRLRDNEFGNKYIIGINVGVDILDLFLDYNLGFKLVEEKIVFLAIDASRNLHWYGVEKDIDYEILQSVFNCPTSKTTVSQVALELDISEELAKQRMDELAARRALIKGRTVRGYTYYYTLVSKIQLSSLSANISEQLKTKIEEYQAIEYGCHYELPSGIHAVEFLHLSKILIEPRFVRKITKRVSEYYHDVDVILTTSTPNNLILGTQLASAYGHDTKIISSNLAEIREISLALRQGYNIKNKRILIFVDVVASGYISNLLYDLSLREGAEIIGGCCIVDVSDKKTIDRVFAFEMKALLWLPLKMYHVENCPLCKSSVSITHPRILPERL